MKKKKKLLHRRKWQRRCEHGDSKGYEYVKRLDSKSENDKPGGTVQKSTVYLGSEHLGLSFFYILEPPAVQKYNICWVFLSFCHMLYLCICVFVNLYFCICAFVFVYLCIWQSRISCLMSLNLWLFKNIIHVGYFRHFITGCICGFVNLYLCICISDSPEYHFWCPWTLGISKI